MARTHAHTLLVALAASGIAGCASTTTITDDGGIVIDVDAQGPAVDGGGTTTVDAGPTVAPDAFTPGPQCGNGDLEAGEQCDDGNDVAGDGCTACARDPHCGDGNLDAGEVCDDRNNLSGDGCRSDCLSNESCGNGVVDYHVGEVCDGAADCAADCLSLVGCGNGTVEGSEQCDDGNTTRWDGCGADCRDEVSVVLRDVQFGDDSVGCDYSGDGNPDNAFGSALSAALPLLNMFFGGGGGGATFLLSFLGLDDPAGIDDPSLRTAWLLGQASGGGYLVNASSLRDDLTPNTSLESSIVSRSLTGGPEDLDVPIALLPLTLGQGRIDARTLQSGGELSGLDDGLVCGGVPLSTLAALTADMIEALASGSGFPVTIGDPCDGSSETPTLADMVVAGGRISILTIDATAPDIDLDGDGLESFEIVRTGTRGCQPVITACIDGDGTRVEGRNCYDDARFADGLTAALTFTATRANITGVN